MTHEKFQDCIDICNDCAVTCDHCTTECLQEEDVKSLARCIELNRICAEICRGAVVAMSSGSDFARKFCALCAEICRACGDECSKHKDMDHCKRCADTCYKCAEACEKMAKE